MRPVPLILLTVLVLAATGCDASGPGDGSPDGAASGDAAPAPSPTLTVPPLRLPTVAAGDECPTQPRRPWSGYGQAAAVLGPGPVYPVADYFGPDPARADPARPDRRVAAPLLRLRDGDRLPGGGYEAKVRWISTGYTGPVLVRAGRIDGPGSASVKFSYRGEASDGGYHVELTEPDNDIPATTLVSGPGCFAYQVDGVGFSATIVFRAALGAG